MSLVKQFEILVSLENPTKPPILATDSLFRSISLILGIAVVEFLYETEQFLIVDPSA